jgi:ABC-2 type transport system ATP-binding protein
MSETTSAPPGVHLAGVTKRYGSRIAVQDLSLELRPGEVFAFLGHNGAGKTTTMKLTVGLLRPDQGRVYVYGHDMVRDAVAGKRHIAYVPDQPFLYDKLTGREFISFTLDMYGISRDVGRRRMDMLIDRLDMADFLDQLAETYSHGMKQRVALAAALVHAPRLLVVDEPLVGLDPRTILVTKRIFRELADQGGTVFMSTHTLDVAEQVADRIGILHHGKLIALGTLADLQRQAERTARLEEVFLQLTNAREDRPQTLELGGA